MEKGHFCINYMCEHKEKGYCEQNKDCHNSMYSCQDRKCKAKEIFEDFNVQDFFFLVIVFLISMLAAVSGIGGGVLFVPTCLFVLGMNSTDSVATSSVLVFFGQTIKVLIGFKSRHPLADRPVVDWQIISVVIAPLFMGTLFGVMFQVILPTWIVMVIFVIVIGITFFKTWKKAGLVYRAEQQQLQDANKNTNI